MWLTRNLCEKICQSLASTLERTLVRTGEKEAKLSEQASELLAAEHHIAIKEISKDKIETVAEPSRIQQSSPIRLCSSVNISFGKVWKLQFFCAEEQNSFEIKTDRQNIHQILSAIIKKCSHANWNIKNLPVWGIN